MRLQVTEVNFTDGERWLFKLKDEQECIFYIMDDNFYQNKKLKNPITKKELDYLDKGASIKCAVENLDGLGVVTKIL